MSTTQIIGIVTGIILMIVIIAVEVYEKRKAREASGWIRKVK